MGIKIVEDIGAPLAVTAVDLLTLEAMPEWNEYAAYVLAAGGILGGYLNYGGPAVKNVGIAALPLAARHVYTRVKAGQATGVGGRSNRLAFRPAGRSGIRQTAFDEFANVRVS